MRRQFNTRLFVILFGSTLALGLVVFAVHWMQTGRIASALLFQAQRAEEQGQLDSTARYLSRYLEFQPGDTAERANLGRILAANVLDSEKAASSKVRQRALFVLEQVVAQDPSRDDLRRQLVRVAMLEDRADLALTHLAKLPEDGEALELTGKCLEDENRLDEAATAYWKAIQADAQRFEAYSRLAALFRLANPRPANLPVKSAEEVLTLLVEKNPARFEARVLRWKHRPTSLYKDADLLAKAGLDVAEALKLAPEEADVLLAAGELALSEALAVVDRNQAKDPEATKKRDAALLRSRTYLNQGIKLHPKDRRMYVTLCQVELNAEQTEAALAALEQGLKASPASFDLLWMQANVLLDHGNEPGMKDRAKAVLDQMTKSRSAPIGADYLQARIALLAGNAREAAQKLESVRIALDRDRASGGLVNQVDLHLANCYEMLDEPGLRHQALERVVKRSEKGDVESLSLGAARKELVNTLIAQARFDDAILLVEKNLKLPGASKANWTDLARVLMARNLARGLASWDEVQQALDKAPPDSIEAHVLQVRLLVIRGQVEDAEKRLDQVRQAFPKHVEPWILKAALADERKQPAKARDILNEAKRTLGDSIDLRLAWTRHWARQSRDEAGPELTRLAATLDEFPEEQDRIRLLRGQVEAFYRLGMTREAQQTWGRVAAMPSLQKDLRVKQVFFDLAMENQDWPTVEQVVADIQRVEGPNGPLGNYGLAMNLIRQADQKGQTPPNEARELLDKLAAARPKWPVVHMARAELEVKAKNLDQAVLRLREAVAAGDSRNPKLVYQLVSLLRQLGRTEEANRELRNLPLQALDADSQWMGVELALRGNDHVEAVKRAMAAVPRGSKNYLDYLRLGTALSSNGQRDEAERNLRLAVQLGEKEPEPWIALCQFLVAQKKKPEAAKVVEQAENVLPAEVKTLALARCREVLGESEKARLLYQDALKERPDHVPTLRMVVNFSIRSGKSSEAEPLLRRVVDGRIKATETEKLWARRGLALTQATRGDFRLYSEALAYVDLGFDARTGTIKEIDVPASGFSVDERRAQAQVLAIQPQRAFRAKAIDCLLEVNKKGDLTADDHYLLARLYEAEGQAAKAREQWQTLVNAFPGNPVYLNSFADHLLRAKEFTEAGSFVKRLEEVEKSNKVEAGKFGSVELTARLLEGRGEGDKALTLLRSYISRPGSKPEEALALVSSLARQRKIDEALNLCDRCWGSCPPEMVSGASVSLIRAANQPTPEQFNRVLPRLEEACQKNPRSALLLLHLADLYDLKGDYPKAQAAYRQILDQDGKNFIALNNLAWLIAQTAGDSNEALQLVSRAIDGLGERPELLDTRASIYLAQKQPRQAIADLERANAETRTDARSFRLARAYHMVNDKDKAARALKEAQQAGLKPEKLHPIEQKAFRQLLQELQPQ